MVEVDCLVVSSLIDSTFMKNEVFSVTDHISLVSPSSSKRWAPICKKSFPWIQLPFGGDVRGHVINSPIAYGLHLNHI